MKATGVVRKIDDLGRIVIPKEIRRNYNINDGDSLEIYIDSSNIILKKYSFLDNISELSCKLVDSYYKIFKKSILITDKEKVISASKDISKNYLSIFITNKIKNSIYNRCELLDNSSIIISEKSEYYYLFPIVSNYDVLGSIILIDNSISDFDKKIIKMLCSFLLKNIEE